ncbi:MAG: hypothetical protein WCJ26_11520 [bacterium]
MKITILPLLFLLSAVSCLQGQTTNAFTKVTSGTEYQYIGTYDLNKMNSILFGCLPLALPHSPEQLLRGIG